MFRQLKATRKQGERREEFKEFEEFKELPFTIRSRFEALDPATPELLSPTGFMQCSALKSRLLVLLELLNSLNSFLCVLNCGRFHS
jgi:hypothetical protein